MPLFTLAVLGVLLPPAGDGPGGGDQVPVHLVRWLEFDPPEFGSDAWFVANNDARHEWIVFLRDGELCARLRAADDLRPEPLPFPIEADVPHGLALRRSVVRVADGWIVGFNQGEFGGQIRWFSEDGTRSDPLSDELVDDFVRTEFGLFATVGISHGTSDEGRIVRIDQGDDCGWMVRPFLDLGGSPEVAALQPGGSLLVATSDRLLRVSPADRTIETLCDETGWAGLSPTSIAVTQSGTIYVGMRHGVAKIEKAGRSYRQRWLLPNEEFATMEFEPGFR